MPDLIELANNYLEEPNIVLKKHLQNLYHELIEKYETNGLNDNVKIIKSFLSL